MTELVLMRHGRAGNNEIPESDEIIDLDAPLTEQGLMKVERIRDSGRFDRFASYVKFSSNMLRARQTMEALFPHQTFNRNAAFDEIRTNLHVTYRYHVSDEILRNHLYDSDQGESILETAYRSIEAMGTLMKKHHEILIVTHAGVINAAFHFFLGLTFTKYPLLHIDNATAVQFSFEGRDVAKFSVIT